MTSWQEADLPWLSSDPEWVRKHAEDDDETPGAGEPPPAYGDYPRTNSGPLCSAEESGYLDSTDVLCPFGPDGRCNSMCPTNRERACILGE